MSSTCYLTNFPWKGEEYEGFLWMDEDGSACELYAQRSGDKTLVGNIYTGKVERVLPQIDGAFVRIGENRTVFLPLEDAHHCIYTKKISKKKELCGGDELLVEIAKDPIKTKDATATANLSFSSSHLLLTTAKSQIGVSQKLPKERRKAYKEVLKTLDAEYGFVVRTNAGECPAEELREEAARLLKETKRFLDAAVHKNAYSLVRQAEHPFLERVRKFLEETKGNGKVRTDLPWLFGELTKEGPFLITASGKKRLKISEKDTPFSFYEDDTYPLYKLIGLPTIVERALAKRVYLSSGAYLVIEPTEALTVIDVNSGKKQGKQSAEEYYYQVNLEAAKEIARQIRLRNISGMVLVDFINLRSLQKRDEVLTVLKRFCKKDTLPVQVLDYTRLHLVELTRKKEFAPLAQQLAEG